MPTLWDAVVAQNSILARLETWATKKSNKVKVKKEFFYAHHPSQSES